MTSSRPDSRQRAALQTVWETFVRDNHWPAFAVVDRTLYQETDEDLPAVLDAVRLDLAVYDPQGRIDSEVTLTIAGIAACDGTETELQRVLDTLRWCVAAERAHVPEPSATDGFDVTRTELQDAFGQNGIALEEDDLDRIFWIFASEGLSNGHSIPNDAEMPWSMHIDKRIRRFKNVATIDQLVIATERQPSHLGRPQQAPAAPEQPGSSAKATVFPTVFVLMPFEADWSTAVYDAIKRGCATGGATRTLRADEIVETGPITTQILAAIRTADLLVADR